MYFNSVFARSKFFIERLSRRNKQILLIFIDVAVLWIAAYSAFVLRLGFQSGLNSSQLAMIVCAP
ncbi:MAG: hypothetical protein KAH44_16365, partial [Oricola sp.]|nr:hypothetical protein [Oricola sp.]